MRIPHFNSFGQFVSYSQICKYECELGQTAPSVAKYVPNSGVLFAVAPCWIRFQCTLTAVPLRNRTFDFILVRFVGMFLTSACETWPLYRQYCAGVQREGILHDNDRS